MTTQVLLGARVFTGERILDGHAVVLEGERIVAVVPRQEAPVGLTPRTLPPETLLVPGFIDLQVNGAGGVLFNESPTIDAALSIATTMRRTGTTGLLPTFITDAPDLTARACAAAAEAMAHPGGGVLGIHLEGPFISPERPGVHAPRHIRQPEPSDLESLTALAAHLSHSGGRLLMTLAPERVDDTFLRRLSDAGAVLFAGHTMASYERAMESIAAGVRGFTHLFNAMPPVLGRQPGPVQAGFSADEAWCSVIVDGHHVHPANLRQLLKAKPPGKVLLVTDAMPPVGTLESTFTLYGLTILRRDGRLVTEDGTLAGADIDMSAAVRNCLRLLGLPLEEALRMASLYPAQVLGLEGRLGRLATGYQADLTLLREDLSVQATWMGGNEQWH
uniref:N-acetylglucosamine-6-phosphate deacetylase n=1 Tax=Myxococcus fulvus TaxID=33 RepID=A0A3Q8I231_MYXFU|nr:N-acetylglucosamine-6-phosphate deacetylase [Myxococcus fulvus]